MSPENARIVASTVLGGGAIELLRPMPGNGLVELAALGPGVDELLAEIDSVAREDAPGVAPVLDPTAARWGLAQLTHLAESVVDRAADRLAVAAAIDQTFHTGSPDAARPEHIWSVDLTLRHLQSLGPQVRSFVDDDPVHAAAARLARGWPLSGVGCGANLPDHPIPSPLLAHPCLQRLFIDRIIEHQDASLGQQPPILAHVVACLGAPPAWFRSAPMP